MAASNPAQDIVLSVTLSQEVAGAVLLLLLLVLRLPMRFLVVFLLLSFFYVIVYFLKDIFLFHIIWLPINNFINVLHFVSH